MIERNFGGKNVDVGLEKDGEKTAVEVELSSDNLLANVTKDLEACDHVIICVTSEKNRKAYEKLLTKNFGDTVLRRVSLEILGSFIETS